ncbi:hypothetical protein, partial [Geobacter sp. OR-1]|uniref:hypothetical protein n=1 Tax=Geobacter sp. OR-1 TaxID=1266765 RepID=UPI00126A1D22
MAYAVPLLKGTWLTSPYREDGPPSASPGKEKGSTRPWDYNSVNREAGTNFGKGQSGAARQADYNTVNRETSSNFGKDGSAPRQG